MKKTICLASLLILALTAFAEIPREINFQGKLVLGGIPATGTHNMLFKIYDDESIGTELWSENHNGANAVEVSNGLFNVILGQITVFPITMDFSEEYWIGISVDGNPEMAPRYNLVTSPYAFRAIYADTACYALTAIDTGNYIENQNSSIQDANFRINGVGEAGIIYLNPGTPDISTPQAGMIRTFGSGEDYGLYFYDGSCWKEILTDTDCYGDTAFGRIYIAERENNRIVRIDDMIGSGWVSYGSGGSGIGQFNCPFGITLGQDSKIYVVDQHNSRVVRVDDMTGTGWTSYGSFSPGIGGFHYPGHIALKPDGKMLIADIYNNRIVQMDNMTGTGWTALGGFNTSMGVAMGADGKIYLADTDNNRIVRVDNISGTGWVSFGTLGTGVGQFDWPVGIAVDNENKIYITDYDNHRIVRIDDMTGSGWVSYGTVGSGSGNFNNPCGIAVRADGKIYIADTLNDRIVRINDMTGAGWVSYGTTGSGVGQFREPMSIAIAP